MSAIKTYISWQEWCEWTAKDEDEGVKEIEKKMQGLMSEFIKVRGFQDLLKKWVHYHQIQEYGNFCQNPHKNLRNYSECLRDLLTMLERIEQRR